MNKSAMLALALAPAALFADPSVERVIVRQQWPWSTDVKVEYSLSGVDASNPVNISVKAFNGEVELPSANLDAAITGDRYGITDPVGTLTIDPVAAFGTEQVAIGNFSVQLTLASAANMNDVIYKIVNLTSPYTVTNVTRKDLMNGKWGRIATSFSEIDPSFSTSLDDVLIWLDVTNDVYKTSKMVFRRIPAAGKSFQFQKGITAATNAYYTAGQGIKVSFAKDYYIGVFEVTQRQFRNMSTTFTLDKFYLTNDDYRWTRPADSVKWWWEDNTYPAATGSTYGSAIYALRQRAKLNINLPTEAMWEYACRAGTDTYKYSGEAGTLTSYDSEKFAPLAVRALGWNGYNNASPDRNCDTKYGTLPVGSLKPNAWGLYDMLGNLHEWCSDKFISPANFWRCACYAGEDNFDPTGPTAVESGNTANRIIRGGSYSDLLANGAMGRGSRDYKWSTDKWNGVRLCIFLTANDDGTL